MVDDDNEHGDDGELGDHSYAIGCIFSNKGDEHGGEAGHENHREAHCYGNGHFNGDGKGGTDAKYGDKDLVILKQLVGIVLAEFHRAPRTEWALRRNGRYCSRVLLKLSITPCMVMVAPETPSTALSAFGEFPYTSCTVDFTIMMPRGALPKSVVPSAFFWKIIFPLNWFCHLGRAMSPPSPGVSACSYQVFPKMVLASLARHRYP